MNRWKVTRAIYFSSSSVVVVALARFAFSGSTSAVEFASTTTAVLLAFVLSILTVRALRRYPKVSLGRTSVFFFLLYAVLASLLLYILELNLRIEVVVASVSAFTIVLSIWSLIDIYLRKRRFLVIPRGATGALIESLDDRFEFEPLLEPAIEALLEERFDGITFDAHTELSRSWVDLVTEAQLARVPAYAAHELVERYSGRIALSHFDEASATQLSPSAIYRGIKRFFDLVILGTVAPVALGLGVIIAIAIKVESTGPVIFKQTRIGEGGREYTIFKFRSMSKDAEESGPAFADEDDSRVTRVGRVLRLLRLDEIPQLWNILLGEMSLIGPRPEQVRFEAQYRSTIPHYSYRHLVKPGITGWAQVTHGYTSDRDATEVKLEHDLYYIKHYSIWLDMLIVLKTLRTIMTGFGAR